MLFIHLHHKQRKVNVLREKLDFLILYSNVNHEYKISFHVFVYFAAVVCLALSMFLSIHCVQFLPNISFPLLQHYETRIISPVQEQM